MDGWRDGEMERNKFNSSDKLSCEKKTFARKVSNQSVINKTRDNSTSYFCVFVLYSVQNEV